ncbi:Zn-ribbon domain-containing OB-fold protein [Calidifontibacillus erzurumensis]|uniref:Zn-ribbon domain-containing OB-fold protein n=1 Tax=Calidifontibacillus erzurumensis TaxID=2741433 RepID=UPI0035B54D31
METIIVHECVHCGKKFVQSKWLCPKCHHTEFEQKKISGRGKVYSFTTIHVAAKEQAHLTPYTVALVDLQDGVRITGRIKEKVNINDEVNCVANEGQLYVFQKIAPTEV